MDELSATQAAILFDNKAQLYLNKDMNFTLLIWLIHRNEE